MTSQLIVPIVEGHGEVEAVPLLIRRIYSCYSPYTLPIINPPARIKASAFLTDDSYFRRYVSLAAAKAAQNNGHVLIFLDCEDDCPARLGPQLLARAIQVRSNIRYTVILAYREYETWFLAAAKSIAGKAGLPVDFESPPNPESIRGAKEWIGRQLSSPYDPIIHQPRFTAIFDLEQARSIPSFDRLITKLSSPAPAVGQ